MRPKTLDHVAYWVADRDAVTAFATAHLGMHVIDRTERFTLIGSDARRGKLTLFDAEAPRERGALEHVALRVSDLAAALRELPEELEIERPHDGEAYFDVGDEGVRLGLVEAPTEVEYDLDHVALRSADPEETASEYGSLGFHAAPPSPSGCPRVEVGGAWIEFRPGSPGEPERPLLNHVAVLVDSTGSTSPRRTTSASRSTTSLTRRIPTPCSCAVRSACASSTSSTSRRSRSRSVA
jgi:catechol 2,3-dioxygenase-like lactoylglutathione lyase family enzyme